MDNAQIAGGSADSVISAKHVSKQYGRGKARVVAVNDVSFEVMPGEIFGLIGPDGAGKTSIIQMLAGVASLDSGGMQVAGLDPQTQSDEVKNIIGYMPQGIGLNLYDSLSVEENIQFFRELRQIPEDVFAENKEKMLAMTRLKPFLTREAKNLSGGMRQKLSLICTLVHLPDILFLDEPTTGVDPRSRQEFWQIILDLVEERRVTVILSTSYMDEAARCNRVALLYEGEIIRQGTPEELKSQLQGKIITCSAEPQYEALSRLQEWWGANAPQIFGQRLQMRLVAGENALVDYLSAANISCQQIEQVPPSLDDIFVQLVGRTGKAAWMPFAPKNNFSQEVIVECRNVTIQFGSFTAVSDISFQINQGEVFGLLGPNGAGKTTLIKSMCGLLKPNDGSINIAGYDVDRERQQVWSQIGYMSQRFSLYRDLTVSENLKLYAGLYQVEKIDYDQILEIIGLKEQARQLARQLPLGLRQRLSLVCAILHGPPVVFLDEPTSGVDPVARRDFWNIIHQLTREIGKTVLVSTHYMDEAERCDRVILMNQGRLVALESPAVLKQQAAQLFGQLITIEAFDVKLAYNAVRGHFREAYLYGQEVHLRSFDVRQDMELLSEMLGKAGVGRFIVQKSPLPMEQTFMDFINHAEVRDV